MMKIGVIDLPVFYMDFAGRAQNKPDYRSSTRDVRRLIAELQEQGVTGYRGRSCVTMAAVRCWKPPR